MGYIAALDTNSNSYTNLYVHTDAHVHADSNVRKLYGT